eukprot:6491187-Amphidinium_carterae.2
MLDAGTCVLVRYDLAGGDGSVWHSRVVLAKVANRRTHIVLTPDYDMFEEELSIGNADLSGVRICSRGHESPAGLRGPRYRFAPVPEASELEGLRREAEYLASKLAEEDAAAHGAEAAARVEAAPGGGAQWRVAANMDGQTYGNIVGLEAGTHVYGGKYAVIEVSAGRFVFAEKVAEEDLQEFMGRCVLNEARVLPTKRLAQGGRLRTIAEIVDVAKEKVFDERDWPMAGPRTVSWVLHYLHREGIGVEAHHERVRSMLRLEGSSYGVAEHQVLSSIFRLGIEVDQIDPTNLCCFEAIARRLQTLEYGWQEKLRDQEAKNHQGRLSQEETAAFGGTTRAWSSLMVSPQLTEHVRVEMEREGKLAKSLRLAREERESAGKKKEGVSKCRKSKQRRGKALARLREVDKTTKALNSLAGFEERATAVGRASAAQVHVSEHVERSVALLGPPPEGSWPERRSRPLSLAALLGRGGEEEIAEFIRHNVKTTQEARQALLEKRVPKAHWDPRLRDQ